MPSNRKIFPYRAGICLFAMSATWLNCLSGQTPPAPEPKAKEVSPQDPLNRRSPQSSVVAFLEICRAGNFERAARYLDLDRLPRDQRLNEGPRLAQQLGRILDRDSKFDVADLSEDPRGDLSDGLPPERERVGS